MISSLELLARKTLLILLFPVMLLAHVIVELTLIITEPLVTFQSWFLNQLDEAFNMK